MASVPARPGGASGPREPSRSLATALACVILMAASAGAQAPADPPGAFAFEGTWSATGTRQILAMGPDRRAGIFFLSGSLVLAAQQGLSRGFFSEAIGLADDEGVRADCAWTDERGDQIFSRLSGEWMQTGHHIHGLITGGTGRYAGITGEYEFDWQYVVEAEDGMIQGRSVGLKGKVMLPAPAGTVPP